VIPFLSDPDNVLVVGEAVFLHDKAPCMRAKATQHLLKAEMWNVWGNWPDLNPAEHIGAIIKDDVGGLGPSVETLKKNLIEVLEGLENGSELLED
jgi:hypothetical protein